MPSYLPRVAPGMALLVVAGVVAQFALAQSPETRAARAAVSEPIDPFAWLEDVNGARPLEWVKAENGKTAKVLQADPHYAGFKEQALKVLESPDRLALPEFHNGEIYNTWQDAEHVRGILRRTRLADYMTEKPHWETVIDYDALAKADNEKWVQKGLNCIYPGDGLCLVALSAGGEDAVTLREFDLKTGRFVAGGFVLPKSKQNATWLDNDTLLVARDWGAGSMTASGYPFIVKVWKRGQPLDQAKEVFRGAATDTSTYPVVFNDAQGHRAAILLRRLDFFSSEIYVYTPSGARRLKVPGKTELEGLVDGQLIASLQEEWTLEGGARIASGSVVALDLKAVEREPEHPRPVVVFAPTAQEFAQQVVPTRSHLLVTTLDHVQGRAYLYAHGRKDSWDRTKLEIPDNQTVGVVDTDDGSDRFFLSLTGFLTPSSLELGDAATKELKVAKTLPGQFDASQDMVEQFEATSKDGTRVPYFLVHRRNMPYDGTTPTLLSAYGGFQVSETPYYSGVRGRLWLERGGAYALANIRGGGEFGPAWHEAGLKTHRQRIYDDFAAVGEALIARKVTSPRRLGIEGGSNGGLLMGVEFEQHPNLWHAVVIEVPLLDMLGFEHIAAGSSWTGEYGSVSVPEERTFLASISPYNNLKPDVDYPEPLIFTTTKDDRVGPVHARKFAALMEQYRKPFFYDEIVEGGHGAGADLKEQAGTDAMIYTYLSRELMD